VIPLPYYCSAKLKQVEEALNERRKAGLRASDIIRLDLIKALIVFLPFLFFLFISTKGTWFLNRVFFLLPVWLFLVWTMGVTQGAMMAAISRAYGVGQ
jgi:hypothetical protein